MDDFQFIIESPQHNHGHKKRPRLVTSCDNCRLKKIKCLQQTPEVKCDACKTAKIPCRFRDRERYFAERTRAIAPNGPLYGDISHVEGNQALDTFSSASRSSSSSISPHSAADRRSSSHSPTSSAESAAAQYQPYPPDSRRLAESYPRHTDPLPRSGAPQGSESAGYNFIHSSAAGPPSTHNVHDAGRRLHLFDPQQPQKPHPRLMPHFIQLFFEQLGTEFPFISYEETIFFEQTMSPLLSNCIASLAARFSNLPELAIRGLHNVAETYGDNAKNILSPIAHIPNMDTLHAMILLSFSEFKNQRTEFRNYCQLAMKMALDLGLSDQSGSHLGLTERDRSRRRATWTSIVQLNMAANSFRA